MPFQKIYEVNFSDFNLQPHINPLGWPSMQLYGSSPLARWYQDPAGIYLHIKRLPERPLNDPAMNYVFLVPPTGISLDNRLLLEVMFDHPQALGFPLGVSPGDIFEYPPKTWGLGNGYSVPEPWALALNINPRANVRSPQIAAKVSCQFHHEFNGVRLNTPGALQKDQAAMLEQPLNYDQYQKSKIEQPDKDYPRPSGNKPILPGPAPIFVLKHSYSGWPASHKIEKDHSVGSGFLTIFRNGQVWAKDHRVYSFPPLGGIPSNFVTSYNRPKIRALEIALSTFGGYGWMSVRIRSFTLWLNKSMGDNIF